MEEVKLISMVIFVDKVVTADRPCDRGAMLDEIAKYSTFLQQPPTLGMFVPCDLDGNVLKEHKQEGADEMKMLYVKEYQQAKERVLFDGYWIEVILGEKWLMSDFYFRMARITKDNVNFFQGRIKAELITK